MSSNNGYTILLESDEPLRFIPYNTDTIVMRSVIGLESSILLPQTIQDILPHIFIKNLNTNSNLIHYGVISISENSEVFKTLVGFPDRFNRTESNDEINVILLFTHTKSAIQSIQVHQIGVDDISISILGDEPILVKKVTHTTYSVVT